MPRRYVVPFKDVVIALAQDLVQVKGAAGKTLKIIRAWWGHTTQTPATAQMCKTECKVFTATVSDGSGGTIGVTPQKVDPGDAAASFTANINNTTPATTSGNTYVREESGDHIYNGYVSKWDERNCPIVGPSESFILSLLGATTGTVNMSGGVEVEEIGG